jgi:hypothetical protein
MDEQRVDDPYEVAVGSTRRYPEAVMVAGRLAGDAMVTRVVGTDLALDRAAGRIGWLARWAVAGGGWLGLLLGALAALLSGPVPASALLGAVFGAVGAVGVGLAVPAGVPRPGRFELRVPVGVADKARNRLMAMEDAQVTVIPAAAPGRRAGALPASDPRASAADLLGLPS